MLVQDGTLVGFQYVNTRGKIDRAGYLRQRRGKICEEVDTRENRGALFPQSPAVFPLAGVGGSGKAFVESRRTRTWVRHTWNESTSSFHDRLRNKRVEMLRRGPDF